ncbi:MULTISPECIES: TAXI family TRAP transporter solute-binding subunit [unclassified Microbacterium]|uniref:TAXI family TRAP transporter solute-binding subunit n=1 Tax=unclassified Microbacterium TaxID=2609290 RepID=UPI00346631A8
MSRRGNRHARWRRIAAAAAVLAIAGASSACSTRSDEWGDSQYAIAGGGSNGVYYAYGAEVARELSGSLGVRVEVAETAGSVDNLLRVSSGEALLGFAQGDAAADAVAGAGAFDEALPVRAVARLYDEYLHVVVRADSDIVDLGDLAGKTVSLGAENSGVNVIAARALDAAEVDIASIADPQLDLSASISALEGSGIDGFFWVGGIPTPGIAELAKTTPVRLVPVEQTWVTAINTRYSDAYRPSDFPVGLYGLDESVPTMAVPNYLVTSSDTPDGIVRDVLTSLFDGRTDIAQRVPVASLLDRRQAIFTGPVDLHPGAIEYYRDERD